MRKIIILTFFHISLFNAFLSFKVNAQEWIYADNNSNAFDAVEWNNKIVNACFYTNDTKTRLLLYLNQHGELIDSATLFISNPNLNFVGFGKLINLNNDTLLYLSKSINIFDSTAYFTSIIIDKNYNKIGEVNSKIDIPFKYWCTRFYRLINAKNDGNVIFGNTLYCGAGYDSIENKINLNIDTYPYYFVYFKLNSAGVITQYTIKNAIDSLNPEIILNNNAQDIIFLRDKNEFCVFDYYGGFVGLDINFKSIYQPKFNYQTKYNVFNGKNAIKKYNTLLLSCYIVIHDTIIYKNSNSYTFLSYNYVSLTLFNDNGEVVKTKLIKPILEIDTAGYSITENGYYIGGETRTVNNNHINTFDYIDINKIYVSFMNQNDQLTVLQLDSNLNISWYKIINIGGGIVQNITATDDGGCLISGWSYYFGKHSKLPLFILKLDKNGSVGFANNILLDKSFLSVYPNPANNSLNFKLQDKTINDIEIYSLSGQLLLNKKDDVSLEFIDISVLPNGLYVYKVGSKNGQNHYGKFVKGN